MDENVAIVKVTQKQQHIAISGMGGLRGLTGPKGEAGAGLQITGSVDTYAELPSTLGPYDAGKAYFNQADGKLYVWSGERFPADGQGSQFVGPEGPAGPTGYSPTATVSKSGTTTTITITDKNGTTTAEVDDGTQLTDGIINGAANNALTDEGSKIAMFTIGTPNLRDNAITQDKIADGSVTTAKLASAVMTAIIDKIYPVGSIYISTSLTTAAQVASAIGGTWTAWGSGRVPVGINTSDSSFNTVEKTGGSKTTTIAESNLPSTALIRSNIWVSGSSCITENTPYSSGWVSGSISDSGHTNSQSMNNLPPYITCYMYKRTA